MEASAGPDFDKPLAGTVCLVKPPCLPKGKNKKSSPDEGKGRRDKEHSHESDAPADRRTF
jgi:hypothetical protein